MRCITSLFVPKIAVFDSGLGSLSIINGLQSVMYAEIVYFADQKHFPYGTKPRHKLHSLMNHTISMLQDMFTPDVIIVGSNTPSLLFPDILCDNIHGVLPPIINADESSKTKNIAIMATHSVINGVEIKEFLNNFKLNSTVQLIDASVLIDLVESGDFLYDITKCKKIIHDTIHDIITSNNIDVVTLSSTHLPFLSTLLHEIFPNVIFLDPAITIAQKIKKQYGDSVNATLDIYTSGDPKSFDKILSSLGVKTTSSFLPFDIRD